MQQRNDDAQAENRRDQIDPIFKEVISDPFGQLGIRIETQVEVSRLTRTIDALVLLTRHEDLENVRSRTAFAHFRSCNQVEFKGLRDRLTIQDYHRIWARTHLYLGDHRISPARMKLTPKRLRINSQAKNQSPLKVDWYRFQSVSTDLSYQPELQFKAEAGRFGNDILTECAW